MPILRHSIGVQNAQTFPPFVRPPRRFPPVQMTKTRTNHVDLSFHSRLSLSFGFWPAFAVFCCRVFRSSCDGNVRIQAKGRTRDNILITAYIFPFQCYCWCVPLFSVCVWKKKHNKCSAQNSLPLPPCPLPLTTLLTTSFTNDFTHSFLRQNL